ncbi:MAG: hypothetical protein M3P85_15845, partial [Actinomycetota bacterium]|nr:hypothetical protein [Actinomycetota bacterium]
MRTPPAARRYLRSVQRYPVPAARDMGDGAPHAQHDQGPPRRDRPVRILSVSEAAALYNFPEERLRRRLDAGGVPGAFKKAENGTAVWCIPEPSLAALGYAPAGAVSAPARTPSPPVGPA